MPNRLHTRHILLILLGLVFVAYCLFQARFLILGPQVSILSHTDGQVVSTPVIELSGKAKDAAWIRLNGRQIFTNEALEWREKLLLSPGPSIITITVRDRFGREKTETIRLILK